MSGDGLTRRSLDPAADDLPLPKRAKPIMRAPNGREVVAMAHPKCETCKSDYREDIERQHVAGYSIPLILQGLPEGHGLSYAMVWNHCDKHVAAPQQLRSKMIQQSARDQGQYDPDFVGSHVTPDLVLDTVLLRGFERIATGELEPAMKDVIAAAHAKTERDRLKGTALSNETFMRVMLRREELFRQALRFFAPDLEQAVFQMANSASADDELLVTLMSDNARQAAIPVASTITIGDEEIEELTLLPSAHASDAAPAVDSAFAIPYAALMAHDSAPAHDSAHAIVIPASEVIE